MGVTRSCYTETGLRLGFLFTSTNFQSPLMIQLTPISPQGLSLLCRSTKHFFHKAIQSDFISI